MGRRERAEGKGAERKDAGIDTAKIAARAYAMYLDRQQRGASGDHLSDWYAAERELRVSRPTA